MDIRKDLESVAQYISRLLSIGYEFSRFDKDWVHLKNEEDFRFISRIPFATRNKVEAVYAEGRDMALYMSDELLSINSDFSKFPTLTAIIERFKDTWVYGNYDSEVPNIAKKTCRRKCSSALVCRTDVFLIQKARTTISSSTYHIADATR